MQVGGKTKTMQLYLWQRYFYIYYGRDISGKKNVSWFIITKKII